MHVYTTIVIALFTNLICAHYGQSCDTIVDNGEQGVSAIREQYHGNLFDQRNNGQGLYYVVPSIDAEEHLQFPATEPISKSTRENIAGYSENISKGERYGVREKRIKRKTNQQNNKYDQTNKKRKKHSNNDEEKRGIISNSMGGSSRKRGKVKCGDVHCEILPTKGDGHCFYHAIIVSIAFGRHPRESIYSSDGLIDYNLCVILNDVFVTSNRISLMYSIEGDEHNMSLFDEDINALKRIHRRAPMDKKAIVVDAMKRYSCLENTVATWETFHVNSPQILFLYIIMSYRVKPFKYCMTFNAVDLFRQLSTVPGVAFVKTLKPSTPTSTTDEPLNKNAICIFQDKEIHFLGLNCTQNEDMPEGAADVTFETDNNIVEQIDFEEKVTCGESKCRILPMLSTTSTYYGALLQSYNSFRVKNKISWSPNVNDLRKNAIISMKLLSDIETFVEELSHFESYFKMDYGTGDSMDFGFVNELQIEKFVTVLQEVIELTNEIREYITKNVLNKYVRQFVFYIYTYALNFGVQLDPIAKRIQENVQLEGVNEIVTISHASPATTDQRMDREDSVIVCVFQIEVNGPRNNRELRYLGVDC